MAHRTIQRSKNGDKLYAAPDKRSRFEDIQSYQRPHGQDVERGSKPERRRKH